MMMILFVLISHSGIGWIIHIQPYPTPFWGCVHFPLGDCLRSQNVNQPTAHAFQASLMQMLQQIASEAWSWWIWSVVDVFWCFLGISHPPDRSWRPKNNRKESDFIQNSQESPETKTPRPHDLGRMMNWFPEDGTSSYARSGKSWYTVCWQMIDDTGNRHFWQRFSSHHIWWYLNFEQPKKKSSKM